MKPVDLSGNLLRVDLAQETTRIERMPEEFMKKYLGGRGLGAVSYTHLTLPTKRIV